MFTKLYSILTKYIDRNKKNPTESENYEEIPNSTPYFRMIFPAYHAPLPLQ